MATFTKPNTKQLKFSIITPTLNQAHFIEDTIQSVVSQNYANFEHIIIDGGSTDGTIAILKKNPHLKWISEKDKGQSEAINKGFRLATGDIIAWLNSDDYYEKGVFEAINLYFQNHEDCFFLYGNISIIDKDKNLLLKTDSNPLTYNSILKNPDIVRQPSSFWRSSIKNSVGVLNENLHLVMDLEYFLRIGKLYPFHFLDMNLSYFRFYAEGKSSKFLKRQFIEFVQVLFWLDGKWNFKSSLFLLKKFNALLKGTLPKLN